MISVFRRRLLLISFMGASLAGESFGQQKETLRQALAAHQLMTDPKIVKNLDQSITSAAVLDTHTEFVIGYYVDDGSGLLKAPIHFARFDRIKSMWDFADVTESSDEYLGSVLSIRAVAGFYLVDTQVSPSAGYLLVLSPEMRMQAKLFGWYLGHLGNQTLIYHRSQVHFAPVHPTQIATFDLQTKRDSVVFPYQPEQRIRLDLMATLRTFYASHPDYCGQNNDPCDPEYFDSDLKSQIVTDTREDAMAFVISYELQGYGQGEEKPSGPAKVLYVYRHVNDDAKLECREILMEDAKARYGAVSLEQLVQPEMLEKIFNSDSANKEMEPRR
jgi:hypothetical protein